MYLADEPPAMELSKYGREYFTLTFTPGLPDDVTGVEARVGTGEWNPAELDDGAWRILLRGPNVDTTDGFIVAKSGPLQARVIDTPEIIVRSVAFIKLEP